MAPGSMCDPLPPEFEPIARKYGAGIARMLCVYLEKWLDKVDESVRNYRRWLESLGIPREIVEKRVEAFRKSLIRLEQKPF